MTGQTGPGVRGSAWKIKAREKFELTVIYPPQMISPCTPFFLQLKVKVAQSCPTLCNPLDYTIRGILQARILEWGAFPFSRGSCQPRDRTQVSRIAGGFFASLGTREAQDKMGPQDEKPCLVLRTTLCVCLAFLHLPWPVLTGGGVSREAVCA